MALRGDLASVDLAQVFQMLALNKKVGLLSIQSAKAWKVLYFDDRGVTLYHNVHAILDRVVAAYMRAGRLAAEAVDEVRDHAARMGQPLADSLLAGGYLQPQELEDQYQTELEEEIYDLFFWRDAKFEFHEGATSLEGRDGTIDERFFFNCDSVIMEAARRIDEWAYISERVPTTAAVLVAAVDSIDTGAYGTDGAAVFELLDGRRNVARIVELTALSNFQVCKVLSQMIDAGAAAPMDQEQLVLLADECMAGGRLQDAISLLERAIELRVGLPEVHTKAAKAYQAAEQYEHAIYHLECEAEHRLAAGDRVGAARRLIEVRQLVPTDLRARHRLVELTLGDGGVAVDGFDALAEGKELVELLLEFGDIQRVRSLLERLLLVEPDDPDLKKALVNVHVKAGDQGRVVELYESIADDLVRQHKPLEAISYLQKILLIDRSRSDVSERVRKLYEFDERSRRRSRTLSVLAVLFCLLLVVGSGYWFYNERAEELFQRIDSRELLAREDFTGARALYEEFLRGNPLTTAVAKANAELQQIDSAQAAFEARRSSARAARERELQQLRSEYQTAWQKHRELFLSGRPEQSMVELGKVRELIVQAGAAEDMAWALEQQVERVFTRLRDFLAESQRLATDYQQRVVAGDWTVARELALRLRTEFENTEGARNVLLPVLINTRPAGALLLQDGKPLQRTVDGREEVLHTPTTVLCSPEQTVAMTAQLDGFAPRQFVVDGKQSAQVEVVLEVVADRRIDFENAAQTGVGVGDGWLAVGLRGGRLGLVRADGTGKQVRSLGGLRAVDSTPRIQGGRIFFTTNENTIECQPLDAARRDGWSVPARCGGATELTLGEGRLVMIDSEHVVHCWEQATGHAAWSLALGVAPSGPATIDRRQVMIGTVDGRVLIVDAADGGNVSVLRSPVGLTTRVVGERGVIWFGCSDGNVRAVDVAEGRVLWTCALGGTPADGDLVLTRSALVALGAGGKLLAIDRANGNVVGSLSLDGEPRHGLRTARTSVLVVSRRAKTRVRPAHDVLVCVDVATMSIAWEYADAATFPGLPAIDDFLSAVPTAAGEVILFR